MWFITYASSSIDISPEMLQIAGIKCDQCYTITWRESKYTLIHLKHEDRVRSTKLRKIMSHLQESHGIIGSSITGYDMLACNEKDSDENIHNHPGFKKMIEILNGKIDELKWWLANGDIHSNRRGLLWKYIESIEQSKKTRVQLREQISKMAPKIEEYNKLASEHEMLKTAYLMKERELASEKTKSQDFFEKLVRSMEECKKLKKRLVENGIDYRDLQ